MMENLKKKKRNGIIEAFSPSFFQTVFLLFKCINIWGEIKRQRISGFQVAK